MFDWLKRLVGAPPAPRTRTNESGYQQTWDTAAGRFAFDHRTVAQGLIGRPLRKGEHVHHLNRNNKDNSRENLVVLPDAIHHEVHALWRKIDKINADGGGQEAARLTMERKRLIARHAIRS